jgi:hypothetical protein
MKLKKLIPLRYRTELIRQFGAAQLFKLPNGQHELIGGTDQDRAAAFEWASLFAHEIVFTHFHRKGSESPTGAFPTIHVPFGTSLASSKSERHTHFHFPKRANATT